MARQASELCRYSMNTLNRWWNLGRVEGVKYRGSLLFSKESPACWLASVKGQNIAVLSEQHREWMKEFQAEEQNSDMEPNSMSLWVVFRKQIWPNWKHKSVMTSTSW